MKLPKSINVLGVDYRIRIGDPEKDATLATSAGYVFYQNREIVLLDFQKEWKDEPQSSINRQMRLVLRHEIIHAFLYESGLAASSLVADYGWAKNEEMVDWMAIQSPKIYQLFKLHRLL